MTDLLTRAWNLLEPGERPEGMLEHPSGFVEDGCGFLPDHVASDRLIVAVEGVLLELRHRHGIMVGQHKWYWYGDAEDPMAQHSDRLHAAVLALEAERGTR